MDLASYEYIKRKIGFKQSLRWRINAILPLLLLIFITAILLFSLILVHSMSSAIENNLIMLAGGHITSYSEVDNTYKRVDEVKTAEGLIYSKDDTALVRFKGINEDYFYPEKASFVNLVTTNEETNLKKIVISEIMAQKLNLKLNDKTAILLYDQELKRVRPVYVFVASIYSTGYKDFDQNLIFCDINLLSGASVYEIQTDANVDSLVKEMRENGSYAYSYKEMNAASYNNLMVSKTIFNFISVLISLLAGLFSISISNEYILRDKKDIASAQVIGFSKKQIARIYRRITLSLVFISLLIGFILSLVFSYLTILILPKLDVMQYPALQNYVLAFNLEIPIIPIVLSLCALFLVSFISLSLTLKENVFTSLKKSLV